MTDQANSTSALPEYTNPMQLDVALFHRAFGLPDLKDTPGPLPQDRIDLRLSLIREEGVKELTEALAANDEVAVADALVDTAYVSLGAMVEMGLRYTLAPDSNPNGVMVGAHDTLTEAAAGLPGLIESNTLDLETALRAGDTRGAEYLLRSLVNLALRPFVSTAIDAMPYFNEVQRANMSKLGADGQPVRSRGEALDGAPEGKVLKGENYSPPDLVTVHVLATGRVHELDKLQAVKTESQAVGKFLDTAGYVLAEWHDEYKDTHGRTREYQDGPHLVPVGRPIEAILADYFGIDQVRAETERLALLEILSGQQP